MGKGWMFGMAETFRKARWNFKPSIEQQIKETSRNDKVVILYHKQKTYNEIFSRVKDKVSDNEFQVHAHTLVVENGQVCVVFPLVYFSFPQKVSGAHVSYKLPDIHEQGEKCKDLAKEQAEKILKSINLPGKPYLVYDGMSAHRHPGRFGFSATDTGKKIEPASVIFRNLEAENKLQIDCVMYFSSYANEPNGEIVVNESRLVNVRPMTKEEFEKIKEKYDTKDFTHEDIPTGIYECLPTIGLLEKYKKETDVEILEHPVLGKLLEYPIDRKFEVKSFMIQSHRWELVNNLATYLEEKVSDPIIQVDKDHFESLYSRVYYPSFDYTFENFTTQSKSKKSRKTSKKTKINSRIEEAHDSKYNK